MEVILLEKVANLGQLGDVVKVKQGFARNYLIPQGKARRATSAALAEFEARRADLERVESEKLATALARKEKLDAMTLTIAQKAGVDGKLFGSVTASDLADAIKAQGVEVAKAMVRLPHGPLKQTGDYQIDIGLHTDVVATVAVSVVGEA